MKSKKNIWKFLIIKAVVFFVLLALSIGIVFMYNNSKKISVSSSTFVWPADGTVILNPTFYHMAVDITSKSSRPLIRAAESGKVIRADCMDTGNGCSIIIDHQNGLHSLYAHNKINEVKAGDFVEKMQEIAVMGITGKEKSMTTTPMLHFELFKYNGSIKISLNPLQFLPPLKSDRISTE